MPRGRRAIDLGDSIMWQWIKVPKAVALLAFLLPWMSVSCSGTKLVSATGYGLALGQFTSELPQQAGNGPGDGQISVWLIAAAVVIAIGLAISFGRRFAAMGVLATSAVAFVLILIGTSRFSKSALMAEAAKKSGAASQIDATNPFAGADNPFGDPARTAAAMIQVEWHFGYWLALGALAIAALMAWLVMGGRDATVLKSLASGSLGASAQSPAAEPLAPAEAPPSRICPQCGRRYAMEVRFCPEDGSALA